MTFNFYRITISVLSILSIHPEDILVDVLENVTLYLVFLPLYTLLRAFEEDLCKQLKAHKMH